MRKIAAGAAGALLLVLLAGCSAENEPERLSPGEKARQQGADTSGESSTTDSDGDGTLDLYDDDPDAAKPVREDPRPDGTYDVNCDYTLGDFGDSGDPTLGYRFIAGGRVRNTGNVGIVVRTTVRWELLGQDPLTERRETRLGRGERSRVKVSVPVTSEQIDAHQSADGDCRTSVKIISTFGRPPFDGQ